MPNQQTATYIEFIYGISPQPLDPQYLFVGLLIPSFQL